MSAEQYFKDMGLHVVIGLHGSYGTNARHWWGQVEHTIDGISVKISETDPNITMLLIRLETAWKRKTEILPAAFSVPKQLAAPVEDAVFTEVSEDEIPF